MKNKMKRKNQILLRGSGIINIEKVDGLQKHIDEMKEKHTYQDLLFYLKNISAIINSNYDYKELPAFLTDMIDLEIYDEEIDG